MTRVLVVDNYDSFVYNLVQYVGELADEVVVRRNDAVDPVGVGEIDPDGVVLSPGPGTPADAGASMPLCRDLDRPILGVCLGHQALCSVHGADVGHAPEVVHGKPSTVRHDGAGIFAGLPNPVRVGRYHSLAIERTEVPGPLVETARTDDERGVVMGVRRLDSPHVGVQFHPESILTGDPDEDADPASLSVGKRMIGNFLDLCASWRSGGTWSYPGESGDRSKRADRDGETDPGADRNGGTEPRTDRDRRADR